MSRMVVILLSILAAGCAHTLVREAPPATVVVTEKCVTASDIPQIPPRAMPKAGTVDQLAAGAGADLLSLDDYAAKADAILKLCATP